MRRNIKFNNYDMNAKACIVVNKKDEIETSIVTAVSLKGSRALQTATGDFGIVVYNELNFGFMISWKQYEKIQSDLNISEEDYEKFLDDLINDFTDSVMDISNDR